MKVELHLPVKDGYHMGSSGKDRLYVRDWPDGMPIPHPEETVTVSKDEWSLQVVRVWYDPINESVSIEMPAVCIDPDPDEVKRWGPATARRHATWWTDVDGDCEQTLRDSGWREYQP